MSFEKVAKLADEFVIKLAEHYYDNHEPQDVKPHELDWLDETIKQELLANKDNEEYISSDIQSVDDEKTWKRAKKAIKPYWKKYENPWAIVYSVYQKMLKGKKKKK